MRPPRAGLRPIGDTVKLKYDAKRPSKSQVNVPPGAVVDVPKVVADQLVAGDAHFKPTSDDVVDEPASLEEEPVGEVDSAKVDVENVCDVCGYVAKTGGGLASHRRSHDEDGDA